MQKSWKSSGLIRILKLKNKNLKKMKNKKFNLASYKYLLEVIKKSKRNHISFNQYFLGKNGVILRHDIDFSPTKALEIAKLEYEQGLFSTFFVMVNSNIYSMQDANNIKAIKSIIGLGHEIGLHFDPSIYQDDENLLNAVCQNECDSIESLLNKKIEIISFHRPEKKFIGMKNKIANRFHSYMPELIEKTKYCSDSEGKWRFDDPEELLNNTSIKNIQLLTHPIWWTTPSNLSPGEKIAFFLKERDEAVKKEAARNCKPYRVYLEEQKQINDP